MSIDVVEKKLGLLPDAYLEKVDEYIELLLFKIKHEEKEKNPILEFSGCINDEDAKAMMDAINECRKIEGADEW